MNDLSFKDRLLSEKKHLDEKIEKLSQFIESAKFDVIEERQRILLRIQFRVMTTYSEILYERISIL